MATKKKAINAPLVALDGTASSEVKLEVDVFGAELKPHLIHEAVRAESAAARAGTRGAKSRGQVAGGAAKPWRQKGTGRARQGTIRAPQFEGGGMAFPPTMRSFAIKVNRKAYRSALRGALSTHAGAETIAVMNPSGLDAPSTKTAASFVDAWGPDLPLLVVCGADEDTVAKSFRNLTRVAVTTPGRLEVRDLAWARTVLVSQTALPDVERIAV
jgi:large subunit ribosomal protein L4